MRQRTHISIILLALCALAAGYLLVVRPIDCKCESTKLDIESKQAALAHLQRYMIRTGDDSGKVELISRALDNFQLKLTQAGEADKVLENISRLAQANSLLTRTIKVSAVEKRGQFGEQEMNVSLVGNFSGFYQFLLQLEDSKRVLRITKLHLSRLTGHEGQVQAEMTLGIFFEPDHSTSGEQR
jgi:Tfp pilus assembly protein PilO